MTVAQASLENLIPQPRKWQEFTTTPIRVPENLKNWVLSMIDQKVAELRFSIGNMAPSEQSEQDWINDVLGFPENYQDGDPLPENIAAAVQEAAAAKSAAAEVPAASTEAAEVPAADMEPEPPNYTQAWIDWNVRNFKGWNWPEYLAAIKQDVREGHQSAKDDLAAFKCNGVDVGGPVVSDKQAAKLARRAARAASNAAVSVGGAAVNTRSGSGQTRKNSAAVVKPITKYDRVKVKSDEIYLEVHKDFISFMQEIEQKCTPGKIDKYQAFFDKWDLDNLLIAVPSERIFNHSNPQMMELNFEADRRRVWVDLASTFEREDKPPEHYDNRFASIIFRFLNCWYFASVEVDRLYSQGVYS